MSQSSSRTSALTIAQTLQWQADMGVDTTVSNEPQKLRQSSDSSLLPPARERCGATNEGEQTNAASVSRGGDTGEQTAPPPSRSAPRLPLQGGVGESPLPNTQPLVKITPNNPLAPAQAAAQVQKLADEATTLDDLRTAITNFTSLAICKTATNVVFSDGQPHAKVMIIGEAPGADEDIQGKPFVGQSGQLMDKALACIGLTREENLYISNTLFWRPPGNRKPTPEELTICLPFINKHIALIKPNYLLFVGGTSASFLLQTKTGITKLHGTWQDYTNPYLEAPIPSFPLYHPSFLLRQPMLKLEERLTESGILPQKEQAA